MLFILKTMIVAFFWWRHLASGHRCILDLVYNLAFHVLGPYQHKKFRMIHLIPLKLSHQIRPINLFISGMYWRETDAISMQKHKRPEGQQMAHILTLSMY